MNKDRIFLGKGKALDFKPPEGYTLEKVGNSVYAIPENFYCSVCEGCGCSSCKFTGEEHTRKKKR